MLDGFLSLSLSYGGCIKCRHFFPFLYINSGVGWNIHNIHQLVMMKGHAHGENIDGSDGGLFVVCSKLADREAEGTASR